MSLGLKYIENQLSIFIDLDLNYKLKLFFNRDKNNVKGV